MIWLSSCRSGTLFFDDQEVVDMKKISPQHDMKKRAAEHEC